MSLAAWSVLKGLDNLRLPEPLLKIGAEEPFSVLVGSVESESFLFLLVDADRDADIFSYSTLNRICFKTPTKSSSTLCSMPAEVSMNLASHDLAKALPSVKWKWKQIYNDINLKRPFQKLQFFAKVFKGKFFKSQILFWDFNQIWIFPPKTRHQITWKLHISKYSKSKMIDFWQFQMCKTSLLDKLNKQKWQFWWKLYAILAGKFKCG